MNCPGHVLIFKQGVKSYRDLPLRYGEFGQCHRNEPSGGLHGIMRVRGFTQDDGHIFCTEDQILPECDGLTNVLHKVYTDFGFTDIIYKVATRRRAHRLRRALGQGGRRPDGARVRPAASSTISPGDGAFYGPKIEYTLKDAIGRQWQVGTMQVDFSMPDAAGRRVRGRGRRPPPPGRAAPGHRRQPGALHRHPDRAARRRAARLAGPVQAVILNITDQQADYVKEIAKTLRNQGLRVETDLRNEKITYKIREHSLQKPPYLLVVGDKEKAAGAVAVRARGNKDLGVMSLASVLRKGRAGHRQQELNLSGGSCRPWIDGVATHFVAILD